MSSLVFRCSLLGRTARFGFGYFAAGFNLFGALARPANLRFLAPGVPIGYFTWTGLRDGRCAHEFRDGLGDVGYLDIDV
jgi:hypothetical protein